CQSEPASDRPRRTLYSIGQPAKVMRIEKPKPRRRIKDLFGDLDNSASQSSAARENDAARDLRFRLGNLAGDMLEQFDRTGLHDVTKDLFRKSARFSPSNRHDLDDLLLFLAVHEKRCNAAVVMLDLVRFGNRNSQANSYV